MMRSTARVGPYLTPSGVHATGLAVLAVLAGLLPGPASASATFGNPDVNVSGMCDDLPCFLGDESEVFIAVNPLNPSHQVVVGHAERALMSTFVSTFYSSDRGATWTWRGIHSESGWPDRDWDGLFQRLLRRTA